MTAIRDKARELLETIPNEVQSKRDRTVFTRLTNGMTHEKLMNEWELTKGSTTKLRTVCIDFVCWYAGQMGIDIISSIDPKLRNPTKDGFFFLQETLEKCGKGYAWVSAANGGRPQYGDILRHTGFHVDVALGFDGSALLRVAGGQSNHPRPTNDVSGEFDNVKRVGEQYNPCRFQGWLDIDRYFSSPIPRWLPGWWKITRSNNAVIYFYFDSDFQVSITPIQPNNIYPPIVPACTGTFIVNSGIPTITIQWPARLDSDSEDFMKLPGSPSESQKMAGISRRWRSDAIKMEF